MHRCCLSGVAILNSIALKPPDPGPRRDGLNASSIKAGLMLSGVTSRASTLAVVRGR